MLLFSIYLHKLTLLLKLEVDWRLKYTRGCCYPSSRGGWSVAAPHLLITDSVIHHPSVLMPQSPHNHLLKSICQSHTAKKNPYLTKTKCPTPFSFAPPLPVPPPCDDEAWPVSPRPAGYKPAFFTFLACHQFLWLYLLSREQSLVCGGGGASATAAASH